MKLSSITFIDASQFKGHKRTTELSMLCAEVFAKLKATPEGKAVGFKVDEAGKHARYSIQSRLQRLHGDPSKVGAIEVTRLTDTDFQVRIGEKRARVVPPQLAKGRKAAAIPKK